MNILFQVSIISYELNGLLLFTSRGYKSVPLSKIQTEVFLAQFEMKYAG